MPRETTTTGQITEKILTPQFKVFRHADGGGYIEFTTALRILVDGELVSESTGRTFTADFADLPPTFPVDVNGSIVQVSGQTILNALDAVADAVMFNPVPTPPEGEVP